MFITEGTTQYVNFFTAIVGVTTVARPGLVTNNAGGSCNLFTGAVEHHTADALER